MKPKKSNCAAIGIREEEARTIGDDIESLYSKGERYDDMAILVRASFQMRSLRRPLHHPGPALSRRRRPALL